MDKLEQFLSKSQQAITFFDCFSLNIVKLFFDQFSEINFINLVLLFLTSIIDFPAGLSVSNTSLKNCSGYWKNMYKNLNFAISNYFQSFWQAKLWISQITLPFFSKYLWKKVFGEKWSGKAAIIQDLCHLSMKKAGKIFCIKFLFGKETIYILTEISYPQQNFYLLLPLQKKKYASIYLDCLSALDIKVKMSFPAYLWKCFCDLCPQ